MLGLVQTLERNLSNAASLIRAERQPFEEYAHDPSVCPGSPAKEDQSSDDSLWEISSDSSTESRTSLHSNRRKLEAPSSTKTSVEIATRPGELPTQEMSRLLESIKFTVGCLYRIPIRKPASLDRLKHKTSLESYYQHFDVLYVQDKFPALDLNVTTRLGKLITRRRQVLKYREDHKESLHTARVQPRERHLPASELLKTGAIYPGIYTDFTSPPMEAGVAISHATSSQFTLHSKATTLRPDDIALLLQEANETPTLSAPSVTESKSSMASSYTGEDLQVNVPTRPTDEQGNHPECFECPYCLIAKNITSERSWKYVFTVFFFVTRRGDLLSSCTRRTSA